MKQTKYAYFLSNKQISRSEMLDFIACNISNDTININNSISMSVANYKAAELKLQSMQRIARKNSRDIIVGFDFLIEVKQNV